MIIGQNNINMSCCHVLDKLLIFENTILEEVYFRSVKKTRRKQGCQNGSKWEQFVENLKTENEKRMGK